MRFGKGLLAAVCLVAAGGAEAGSNKFQTILTFNGSNGYGPSGNLAQIGTSGYGATYNTVTGLQLPASPGAPFVATVIHNFAGGRLDGVASAGGVIARGGKLFGATSSGGIGPCNGGCGVVYVLDAPVASDGTWHEQLLYRFTGANGDGESPSGPIAADAAGNLYGTTQAADGDDMAGGGIVYKLTPPGGGKGWTETVIHHFLASSGDGYDPNGPLVVGTDGSIYGSTFYGGTCNSGTIYKLTPPATSGASWTETILLNLQDTGSSCDYSLGDLIASGLTLGPDNLLYGATFYGGSGNGGGVVFNFDPVSLAYNVLWTFGKNSATDGSVPESALTLTADGTIYGATSQGGTGSPGAGVIYKLTPSNGSYTETILHAFTGGTDGGDPRTGILIQHNGAIFGTTAGGGNSQGFGTAFRIAP